MMRWLLPLVLVAPLAAQVSIGAHVSMTSGVSVLPSAPNYTFTQLGTTPVLTKGSTYDGWKADAIAAPSSTIKVTSGVFAGTFVGTFSLWSIANSQWASAFFTSPDLATWTYVSGSLQAPTGGDYILGNGGIVVTGSTFIWTYTHYPLPDPGPHNITIATSTDLIHWTIVNSDPTGNTSGQGDPELDFNPAGTLELVIIDNSAQRFYSYTSTNNGTSWTPVGAIYPAPANVGTANTGAPSIFYYNNSTFLTYDQGQNVTNYPRYIRMVSTPGNNVGWNLPVTALTNNPSLPWQSVQVFDCSTIVADRGDGRGPIPWMLFSGGDNSSPQDNTDSSIGLAYLEMY